MVNARKEFRAIPAASLTARDFESSTAEPELVSKTVSVALGQCHAFLSHSWSDPAEAKHQAVTKWAESQQQRLSPPRPDRQATRQRSVLPIGRQASKEPSEQPASKQLLLWLDKGERTEQQRTEQQRAEQQRAEQQRAEQQRTEQQQPALFAAHIIPKLCTRSLAADLSLAAACIDQRDIERSLRYLPVYLAGCQGLLVIAGPTYATRLWVGIALPLLLSLLVPPSHPVPLLLTPVLPLPPVRR